ncbi:RraA family protein [Companilactobacillus allii]|uniref:Putative 4-hydroxy-4-methyl-2-oxoglutarate aldolase n=1 Tax=Companilactobacillus allii TaxID=1847728 RepID=A0A1P8Q1L2_9LACO|nr:diguanylate cyclase [Companilactobacillus allii]APX71717.1 diguanylate cyclase [Companilactobacillus allii]USQ68805.1 RraA family protein [Companilactobacillus allii]
MQEEKIITELKKQDVTSVSDALDSLGIPCGAYGIKPIQRGIPFCGRAFTVHYVPCGMKKGTVGDFLDDVLANQVVVIDNAGRTDCTVWGDIMTNVANQKDIAATVINGVCRDIPGILSTTYPVYSKGFYMVTGKERVQIDTVNEPVSLGEVQVRPNDIIMGDDTGVVVIPDELAEKVLKVAISIQEDEQGIIQLVKNGSTLKEARAKMGYFHLQSQQK